MSNAHLFSLVPVVAVALLLFFSTLLYGTGTRGLAVYCLAVAVWSGALAMATVTWAAPIGHRLIAAGAFVPAGYLHAAFDISRQTKRSLLLLAYLVAGLITAIGVIYPRLLHDPVTLQAGPAFWPAMVVVAIAAALPVGKLAISYQNQSLESRQNLRALAVAGLLGFGGAALHTITSASGSSVPLGLFIVLASLFVLAGLVRRRQSASTKRILERSLAYSVVAAFVSAGFLLGVFVVMRVSGNSLPVEYGLSALFLLFMAALAFEPLRQHVQELISKKLTRSASNVTELAEALVDQEERADQAGRLAELGVFTSAVAHEVRNPLGVLSAHLRMLEKASVDSEVLGAMREQIGRAETFVEDLLSYGRPRPLEIRSVDFAALVDLAYSTALSGFGEPKPNVDFEKRGLNRPIQVEVDQSQMLEVLVIFFENALLELHATADGCIRASCELESERLRLCIEDNGPGVPAEIRERLFEPFVTGRKRGGPKGGTGLGLAIARGIVERHGGSVCIADAEIGGARFDIELPLIQKVMGTAKGAE
ncbi:MAG: hypothetical protein A2289_14430 [Deltaproteobacteria bacterium RIFOXYA12_FULL_58_15]|nr:MAG: hypothetical protein A2289_14430 [Deltaproteobacteria bacterium RIFOXYA12_FULL_58_15]OGR07357.1 MAG: hypothetical protein A2341_03210 [Deltaproteobacteria bacterium RIFOXYB12_FULL_58_9]